VDATEIAREPAATSTVGTGERVRRHELDWVRSLIVLGLIPIHTATLFSVSTYLALQSTQTSLNIERIIGFTTAFAMPLLFLVSGAASGFSLRSRTPRQYVQERLTRLLLPFAFATLALIPLQVYAVIAARPELLANAPMPVPSRHVLASYLHFYPAYVVAYGYFLSHYSLALVPVFWAHLWFLPRLLAVAILALPILLVLRSSHGRGLLASLGRRLDRPGGILLLAIPVAVTNLAFSSGWLNKLTASWPIYDDWSQFLLYFLFFLLGYAIYADARLLRRVPRDGLAALVIGCGLWMLAQIIPPPDFHAPLADSMGSLLYYPLRSMIPWLLAIGILNIAIRFFQVHNGLSDYINDAAFPVYVLHMPIIIVLGLAVADWPTGILTKFLVIAAGTCLALYLLYDRLIRHTPALRVLFGMKAHPPSAAGKAKRRAAHAGRAHRW
jgi:surface polysaccharide O-acyltransferase-like enzyme